MNSKFNEYCETLWNRWINKRLEVSSFIDKEFQMAYLPEPYLGFGDSQNPLYVLTTNPGQGMPVQLRDSIYSGKSPISKGNSYKEISELMANYYMKHLKGAAKRRIEGFYEIAIGGGFDGVIQVESCPFHSAYLPKKNKLLKQYSFDSLLRAYTEVLKETLKNVSVISISAVATNRPLSTHSISSNPWLNWQSYIIGYSSKNTEILPITARKGRTTSAFLFNQNRGLIKGFILTMGGNYLPSSQSLNPLLPILKEVCNVRQKAEVRPYAPKTVYMSD